MRKVRKDQLAHKAYKDLSVRLELRVRQVRRASKEFRVRWEIPAQPELRVLKVRRDHRDHRVLKVHKVRPVQLDPWDQPALQVRKACKASQGSRAQPELMVFKAQSARLDHKAFKAQPAQLARKG